MVEPLAALPEDLAGWRRSRATAQSASEVAAELLRCVREDDAPPDEDLVAKLADAAIAVIEIGGDMGRDGQLLGALRKWQVEQGYA